MNPVTHFLAPGLHFLFGLPQDYVPTWVSSSSAPGTIERRGDQGTNIHTPDLQGQKGLFPGVSTENLMSPTCKGTGGLRVAAEEGPSTLCFSSNYCMFGASLESVAGAGTLFGLASMWNFPG